MSSFAIPCTEVRAIDDMKRWQSSLAHADYMGFIMSLNESVRGKSKTDVKLCPSSPIQPLIALLSKLEAWIDEIPPVDQPQRFGNVAFRTWFNKLAQEMDSLLQEALPESLHPAILELGPYLNESFGNNTRIDYGTGHEMSFAMFLCCLFKLHLLQPEDCEAVVLTLFDKYIAVVRKLLKVYKLEPAGSHGSWSLDDYHFLPFIWGSSQLIGQMKIEPKDFPNGDPSGILARDYMFLDCINFLLEVKSGPFYEHSNQLWNISGVRSWDKINKGLIKMYVNEVLGKFPVIQHVRFGSILPFHPCVSDPQADTTNQRGGTVVHSMINAKPISTSEKSPSSTSDSVPL